jgi:hypothetical protein
MVVVVGVDNFIKQFVIIVIVIVVVRGACVNGNIELGEISFGSRSYECNDMGGTKIDDMCVTMDVMVERIKADCKGCLAAGEP